MAVTVKELNKETRPLFMEEHPGLTIASRGAQCDDHPGGGWHCTLIRWHKGIHVGHIANGTPNGYWVRGD